MSARRLIVNADDYGLTPGVDRGIEAAVATGSVTSVSVMANLAPPAAVTTLAARHPQLSLGVHLNLTTGRPLRAPDAVPSLVEKGGEFASLAELTRRALRGRIRSGEVRAELAAQVEALVAAGVVVDHLDSHEHVHLLPGVTGAVIAVARAGGIERIRTHRPRLLPVAGRGWWKGVAAYYARHPRRVVTHGLKHALAARLRLAGLRTPSGMVGGALLLDAVGGGPLAEWEAVCAALPPGTWELVVHPADLSAPLDGREAARLGELVARRGAERAALVSPAFAAMVCATGVTLVSFAAVTAGEREATTVRAEGRHVA